MSEKFKEIAYKLPSREMQILRSAAQAMNDNDNKPLSLCKLYLPGLSDKDAWAFLLWLRKNPA